MNQCSCLVQRVRLEARPLASERVGVAERMRRAVVPPSPIRAFAAAPPYITSLLRECKATTVGSPARSLARSETEMGGHFQ